MIFLPVKSVLNLAYLLFSGKSLKEMETPLSALGIQNGCRLMLIGEKVNCFFHQNSSESND
jgi:hypothetical protein